MSNSKRLLSVFLICALIFSALSGTISSLAAAPAVDSTGFTRMEAETYGVGSNHFNPDQSDSVNASGGKVFGGLNCDYDKMQTLESLSSYLDKTNTAYVAFTVDAPADGVYKVMPGYNIGKNDSINDVEYQNYLDNYQMVLFVNDCDVYTSDFVEDSKIGTHVFNKSTVEVSLSKGRNIIRMIPVTYEQRDFKRNCWINIDYLDVQNTLTAVEKAEPAHLEAGYSSFISRYGTISDKLGGDQVSTVYSSGNTMANFEVSTIGNYSYFAYTIDVPTAGYYDISATFRTEMTDFAGTLNPIRHGYMVNGVPFEAFAVRSTDNGKNNMDYNRLDLTTYLKEGSNVLLLTCNIAEDADSKEKLYWTDWGKLLVYGGTKADVQIDPKTVTAERAYNVLSSDNYAAGFNYNNLTTNKYAIPQKKADVNFVQSYADMVATSSLQKTGLPYVTYMVKAAKAGKYYIKQNVLMATEDANNYDGYFSVISVNDKQFHKVEGYKFGANEFELEVELEKGVNIVRCIAHTKETYADTYNYNIIQQSLAVAKPLKGVLASVAEYGIDEMTRNSDTDVLSYVNLSSGKFAAVINQGSSRKTLDAFTASGHTYDTVTQEKLNTLPYVAKTVEVPADGYYDITYYIHTGYLNTGSQVLIDGMGAASTVGATGYVVLRVDGTKSKVTFTEAILPNTTGVANRSNITAVNATMYLKKGTRTIMFSAPMDYKNGETSKFYHASYIKYIDTNGLAEAATQVDPYDIPDTVDTNTVTNHLEAEIFGTAIGFEDSLTGLDGYSARGALGGVTADAAALQSATEMASIMSKATNPMVTFIVNAATAGTYNFTPVYKFTGNTAGYKMTVAVNDKSFYDCDFVQAAGKDTGWNSGSADIELDAGINVIRVIPFTSDNASYYVADSINLDYALIESNDASTENPRGVLPQTAELGAQNAPFKGGFASTGGKLSGVKDMAALGINANTITTKYLSDAAYFSYTVNAPVSGYYDITLPYTVGAKAGGAEPAEADRNFVFMVDNNMKIVKFTKNGTSVANASVYLEKGNHSLTFVAQLPATDAGVYGETTFTTLILNGGLTVVNTDPINPVNQNRMEAERYGITSTYNAKEASGGYSGGYAYGNGAYGAYDSFKSDADMLNGNFNKGIANVEFTFSAPVAGTKQLRVGYKVGTEAACASALEALKTEKNNELIYLIIVNADGAKGYPIVPGEWVDVEVAAGENKAYVSTFSVETYTRFVELGGIPTKIWANIDYLDIDDGLTKVLPKSEVAVIAEAEEYGEAYNYPSTEKGNYSGGIALSQGAYGYSSIPAEADYFNNPSTVYTRQPHAIYTVEAEVDGTYSLTSGYRFGTNGKYPENVHTYLIVTDGNNVTTTYQQNGSGDWVDVQLTKGKNTVVATIFDKETYQATMGGGQGGTWMNMDYLGLYSKAFEDMTASGLEYAIRPVMPEGANPVDSSKYVRFEAESDAYYDAYTDQYKYGAFSQGYGRSVPNGLYFNAQTKAQILAQGINRVITPTLTYYVTVEQEGDYEIINGLTYTALGENLPAGKKAYVAVAANGAVQIKELDVSNFRTRYTNITSTVHLKAGLNKIQITSATHDSIPADELSSVAVYHDYMDIADLNATVTAPVTHIEAEESKLRGYTQKAERGQSPSGKDHGYAGGEAFGKVVSSALTLEKLNTNWDYLAYASYVEYIVIAPEAGVYPVEFLGWTGWGGNVKTHEVFVGMSVNEGKFEKMEFRVYGNLSAHFSRVYDIALNEGENKIILTCMLFDVINSSGNLYWVDHDCIILPEGVGTVEVPPWPEELGDDEMHVHDQLFIIDASKVKPSYTITVDEDGNIVGSTGKPNSPQTGESLVIALPMILALVAVGGMALIAEKKRRQRNS